MTLSLHNLLDPPVALNSLLDDQSDNKHWKQQLCRAVSDRLPIVFGMYLGYSTHELAR